MLTSIGMGIAGTAIGPASDRFGTLRFITSGAAGIVGVTVGMSQVTEETTLVMLAPLIMVGGLAMGLFNVPMNSRILSSVPAANLGSIGAFAHLARNFGNVSGQAIATSIVASVMASRGFDIPLDEIEGTAGAGAAFVAGWRTAYLSLVGVGVAALVIISLPRARGVPARG
jgi:sugar phosphate permease